VLIVGLDVVKKDPPEYAVVVREDGETIVEKRLTKPELLELLASIKPDIIAVDNIYELVSTTDEIKTLIKTNPEVRIIQVTGGPDDSRSLQKAAREAGIDVPDPRDPEAEALACALLAEMGEGTEAFALEDETIVKIGRIRKPGSGGFSQSRYARNLHISVKRATEDLIKALESEGMDYDVKVRRAEGGYASAEFTVYERYDKVKPVVSRIKRRPDVKVKIEPVVRDRITLSPRSHRAELLTIGVDPGTTTALAVLDADGNVIELKSSKDLTTSDIIERVESLGRPAVVATDVTPVPKAVERIAKSLGARLYTPKRDMTVDEKRELVKGHLSRVKRGPTPSDTHQRDALAAAIKAYHTVVKPAVAKVERKAPEGLKRRHVLRAASYVVKGLPVTDALRIVEEERATERKREESEKEVEEYKRRLTSTEKKLARYEEKLEEYRKEIEHLERTVERLKAERDELREKLDEVMAEIDELVERKIEKILRAKDAEIKRLRAELNKEKTRRMELERELREVERLDKIVKSGKGIPVITVRKASHDELSELKTPDRFVLAVEDPSGMSPSNVEEIERLNPEAVVVPNPDHIPEEALEEFRDRRIPLLREDHVKILRAGHLALIREKDLEKAVEEALNRWEREEREKEKERILECIQEYQRSRERKLFR